MFAFNLDRILEVVACVLSASQTVQIERNPVNGVSSEKQQQTLQSASFSDGLHQNRCMENMGKNGQSRNVSKYRANVWCVFGEMVTAIDVYSAHDTHNSRYIVAGAVR